MPSQQELPLETRKAYMSGTRNSPRHFFIFKIGDRPAKKIPAIVHPARRKVKLLLTAAHVERAINLKGFGDGQNCAGAICAKEHVGAFGHKFTGFVDWFHQRAYISSKDDPITGLPKECYAYTHQEKVDGQPIAKLFDTKAGLRTLLGKLQAEGPMEINLYPPTYKVREKGRAGGKATGKRIGGATGHRLRKINVKAGGLLD